MPSGYEVFDADEVLFEARRRATWARRILGLALLPTAALLYFWFQPSGSLVIGGLMLALWLGVGGWAAWRLQQLHRVAWCLKLSAQGLEAYDYTRHRLRLPWARLQRVEVTDAGIRLVGSGGQRIRVPDRFPDFPALSHRLTRRAEAHGVPLWIDGRPYQDLDVYALFPSLMDDASYGAEGMGHSI